MSEITAAPSGAEREHIRFGASGRALWKKIAAAGLVRFAGWWSLFAGALALNSVCPVCGNAGCPTGIGSFGLLAAVLAFAKQYGGMIARRFVSLFTGRAITGHGGDGRPGVPGLPSNGDHGYGHCACSSDITSEGCSHERE